MKIHRSGGQGRKGFLGLNQLMKKKLLLDIKKISACGFKYIRAGPVQVNTLQLWSVLTIPLMEISKELSFLVNQYLQKYQNSEVRLSSSKKKKEKKKLD